MRMHAEREHVRPEHAAAARRHCERGFAAAATRPRPARVAAAVRPRLRRVGALLALQLALHAVARALVRLAAALRPLRTTAGAVYRSLLLPGWGQVYNRQPVKAGLFAGAEAAARSIACPPPRNIKHPTAV